MGLFRLFGTQKEHSNALCIGDLSLLRSPGTDASNRGREPASGSQANPGINELISMCALTSATSGPPPDPLCGSVTGPQSGPMASVLAGETYSSFISTASCSQVNFKTLSLDPSKNSFSKGPDSKGKYQQNKSRRRSSLLLWKKKTSSLEPGSADPSRQRGQSNEEIRCNLVQSLTQECGIQQVSFVSEESSLTKEYCMNKIKSMFKTSSASVQVLHYIGDADECGNWNFGSKSNAASSGLGNLLVFRELTMLWQKYRKHSQHLVLLLDCPSSGHWVKQLKMLSRAEQLELSLCIQASQAADMDDSPGNPEVDYSPGVFTSFFFHNNWRQRSGIPLAWPQGMRPAFFSTWPLSSFQELGLPMSFYSETTEVAVKSRTTRLDLTASLPWHCHTCAPNLDSADDRPGAVNSDHEAGNRGPEVRQAGGRKLTHSLSQGLPIAPLLDLDPSLSLDELHGGSKIEGGMFSHKLHLLSPGPQVADRTVFEETPEAPPECGLSNHQRSFNEKLSLMLDAERRKQTRTRREFQGEEHLSDWLGNGSTASNAMSTGITSSNVFSTTDLIDLVPRPEASNEGGVTSGEVRYSSLRVVESSGEVRDSSLRQCREDDPSVLQCTSSPSEEEVDDESRAEVDDSPHQQWVSTESNLAHPSRLSVTNAHVGMESADVGNSHLKQVRTPSSIKELRTALLHHNLNKARESHDLSRSASNVSDAPEASRSSAIGSGCLFTALLSHSAALDSEPGSPASGVIRHGRGGHGRMEIGGSESSSFLFMDDAERYRMLKELQEIHDVYHPNGEFDSEDFEETPGVGEPAPGMTV